MSWRSDNILAAQRLDICEPTVPRAWCNARLEDGRWCPNQRTRTENGRRLCSEHQRLYRVHDMIVARILTIPPRDIESG